MKRKDVGADVGANVGVNELYDFMKSNQTVNISMLVEKFDAVTKRTIERWIKQLQDKSKIEFVGASKTGGMLLNKLKPKSEFSRNDEIMSLPMNPYVTDEEIAYIANEVTLCK